jgi:hypothetical protein
MSTQTIVSNTDRPPHTTSGSARRAARSVSKQGLIYRLASEMRWLQDDLAGAPVAGRPRH